MSLFESDFDKEDIQTLSNKNQIVVSKKVKEIEKPKQVLSEYVPVDYRNRVSLVKKLNNIQGYDDFTKELYPYSINFYDFEVFMCDWCVTIINPVRKEMTIIVNDEEELKRYYETSKNEIWCGYNSRTYDSTILKSILCDMNPKKVSDMMIVLEKKPWEINRDFSKIQFYDFDIFDGMNSLKQLEAFMGNNIKETEVDFNINRQLIKGEILQTIKYNKHDVEQTIEVFRRRKSVYDSQLALIETFNMPFELISSTQAQLTARILECERVEGREVEEFNFPILPCLKLSKYKYVYDWFMNPSNRNYKSNYETEICGIPHQYGWGGLHGCPSKPIYREGRIFHVDVASYYPSMMIQWNLLTRNCKDPKKYETIYHTRLELKRQGRKAAQAPYKIVLNGTYGICKDKYSLAYDPMQANAICVNGQLLLTDLLEKLEPYCEVIQSNTDGLIIMCEDTDLAEKKVMHVCKEWENRTRFNLEKDRITFIFQKDVNNYAFSFAPKQELMNNLFEKVKEVDPSAILQNYYIYTNKVDQLTQIISDFEKETKSFVIKKEGKLSILGKIETKGAYVKELSDLDNDLPIINKALVNYMFKGILPEETVQESVNKQSLIDFQKIVRVKGDFKFGWHNGKFLTDRTFRVFASNDYTDTYIGRCKSKNETIVKFGNTPEHCFIVNDDIHDCFSKWGSQLDTQWYVNLSYKRLSDFGIDLRSASALF